jgi:phenylpropionate dioxygenase-like ring-hydroxylating dioxygenase large terminal subunit
MSVSIGQGLDAAAYLSAEIAAQETARIFARVWTCVGSASALASDDDWISAEVAGRGIFVQNFDGALRGYRNVCSHRHARLRSEPSGHGPVRCPYHAWTYNADGVPVGIPGNAEYFGLDRAARQALALKPVEVALCGDLVFARLEPGGPDLEAWLGPFFAPLAAATLGLGKSFTAGTVDWACNWKLGIENAIEGYHLGPIHPETFRPFVAEVLGATFAGDHSLGPSRIAEPARLSLTRTGERLGLHAVAPSDLYDHYLVFPNLCVTVTGGLTLSVQTYQPLGPDRVRIAYRLATSPGRRPDRYDSVTGRAALGAFAKFNERVLDEDRRAAESVQAGLGNGPVRRGILGTNEERILAFHEAWRRAMMAP